MPPERGDGEENRSRVWPAVGDGHGGGSNQEQHRLRTLRYVCSICESGNIFTLHYPFF